MAGWEGYEQAIRHQTAMGDLLRVRLTEEGWQVVNDTPLPLVNFVDGGREGRSPAFMVLMLTTACEARCAADRRSWRSPRSRW